MCSAVFQAGGFVVVLVEVTRKAYLASIVPVIVNAILNEHQIVVDIVAFVNKGDFPRSRLGEKQRGKILASWVTRKMRTMAQFAIRDMDPAAMGGDPGPGEADPSRQSTGSLRNSGLGLPGASSSLRNVEHAPQILEQEEMDNQMEKLAALPDESEVAEMPGPDQLGRSPYHAHRAPPPMAEPPRHEGIQPGQALAGPPLRVSNPSHGFDLPDFDQFGNDESPPPGIPPKPTSRTGTERMSGTLTGPGTLQGRLPGVDGRESLDLWDSADASRPVADEDDWKKDALMHMNLAADMNERSRN